MIFFRIRFPKELRSNRVELATERPSTLTCRNRNLRALLWSGLLNMQGHLQRTSKPHERRGAARHGGHAYTSHCHGRPYSFRSVAGTSRQHREQHDCPSELPHSMALHGVNVVSQHPRGTPRSSRDSGRSERKTPLAMPPAVSPTTLTMNSSREPQPAPKTSVDSLKHHLPAREVCHRDPPEEDTESARKLANEVMSLVAAIEASVKKRSHSEFRVYLPTKPLAKQSIWFQSSNKCAGMAMSLLQFLKHLRVSNKPADNEAYIAPCTRRRVESSLTFRRCRL